MSEPVKISIKWHDAVKRGPDETDLIRMLDEVVGIYTANVDPDNGKAEVRRAVDWLQSKYGTKR